jgi:endogenous inhibitor of DNA gyrase (YacG/DUF329 family)
MYRLIVNMECPICKKQVEIPKPGEQRPQWFPFCSEKCKFIDLGKWLDSDYRIEAEPNIDEDDEQAIINPE